MTCENGPGFDAGKRIRQINVGSKDRPVWVDYLEVKDRVLWARTECPEMEIRTELLPAAGDLVVMRATVARPGAGMATGHGSSKLGMPDAVEKAETAAVGRALAYLGYGTAAALAEEGQVCDSPVSKPESAAAARPAAGKALSKGDVAAAVAQATATAGPGGPLAEPACDLVPADPDQAVLWFRARVKAMPTFVLTEEPKRQIAKALAITLREAGIPDGPRELLNKRLTSKPSGLQMDPRELQLLADLVKGRPEVLRAIAGVPEPEAKPVNGRAGR